MALQFVATFLVAYAAFLSAQQNCPDSKEQMMECFMQLKDNADYKTIMMKMPNIAKSCGATDKNVQCFQALKDCQVDSYNTLKSSPEKQSAKRALSQCYTDNPNDPLVGLDSLFMGMGMDKKGGKCGGHGEMKGKKNMTQMGGSREAGPQQGFQQGMQQGMMPQGMMPQGMQQQGMQQQGMQQQGMQQGPQRYQMPEVGDMNNKDMKHEDFLPADCKPPGDMMTMHTCFKQAIVKDQTIITAAQRLRPEVKRCEDLLPTECEPDDGKLHECLKNAMEPIFKLKETTFTNCMRQKGFPLQMTGRPM